MVVGFGLSSIFFSIPKVLANLFCKSRKMSLSGSFSWFIICNSTLIFKVLTYFFCISNRKSLSGFSYCLTFPLYCLLYLIIYPFLPPSISGYTISASGKICFVSVIPLLASMEADIIGDISDTIATNFWPHISIISLKDSYFRVKEQQK